MSSCTIALIILAAVIVLFATEKIPLSVTAILAMLAMGFTGILSFSDAFSPMSSTVVWVLIGTAVMGEAFFTTGIADTLAIQLFHFTKLSEKMFTVILFIIGAVLSALFNGLIVMAVFMPIIDLIVSKSNGKFSRKNAYLPFGIASVVGGNLTIIGSTSMMSAVGLYMNLSGESSVTFLAPFLIGLPGVVACIIMYLTFGLKLQNKTFNFEDIPACIDTPDKSVEMMHKKDRKFYIAVIVLIVSIVGFISGINMGGVAMAAAVILIVTGCIDVKQAYKSINWDVIFTVVGAMALGKGIEASGAGEAITDFILNICGPIGQSPFGMCVIMFIISTIISNFMSNNATVVITVPIAYSMALALGAPPLTYVLICAVGANLSLATPICTACITLTRSAGYRFKDFLVVGGAANVLAVVATSVAVFALYFR